jgi:hypothetical protein
VRASAANITFPELFEEVVMDETREARVSGAGCAGCGWQLVA